MQSTGFRFEEHRVWTSTYASKRVKIMSSIRTVATALPPALCTPAALQTSILSKLKSHVGRRRAMATKRDWLLATAIGVRDFAVDRWLDSLEAAQRMGAKRVYYLSLEFLIGRLLFDNL